MKSGYGQFCPVAVASEIFAERWTPIILRELVLGSRKFNDIHRGVPRMSRALLAKRLRKLTEAGVIGNTDGEYRLTPSGEELGEVVVRLGEWGQRWAEPVRRANLDSRLLMWDMRRRIALERLPDRRLVVRFDFRGVPGGQNCPKVFWLVMTRAEVDLCIVEPGHEVDLFVDADLAAFSRVWLGEVPMRQVIREGGIKLSGARDAVRDFPSWLLLSTLAAVPRPEQSIQRRWLWTPPLLPRREAVSEERANSANGEKEKPRDPTASICQSGVSTQPLEDGGFSWRRLRQLPSISQSGYLICTR